MKIVGLAIVILLISTMIRMDLVEGTISLANFEESSQCEESHSPVDYVVVKVEEEDSIESLLGIYSDSQLSFPEKVQAFYVLNPVYKKQEILPGELVKIPVTSLIPTTCTK
ncbi:hypothetical protein [Paenisporosarcina cavernae]|uniref:Uncharacterized protein n=1 Tax=Paenisporosarcina cavernae TaxID=2320858 RepID=A0A385YV70_9BACL|nr:hypothetical protein [Paenisporosarcina cavernae]AYC29588.1 hypothetical protein D3873_06705 [Paenisporosarcina cavernae]